MGRQSSFYLDVRAGCGSTRVWPASEQMRKPAGKARQARDRDIAIIEAWLPKDKSIPSLAVNWEERLPEPLAEYPLVGVNDGSGLLTLSQKVACFDLPGASDLAAKIQVAGNTIYFGKAKYSRASTCGITRCGNGFAIGTINLRAADS